MRRLPLALFAIGAFFAAREARAGEPMLELAWTAPETCPDGAHVVTKVEELVGHPTTGRTLRARVKVAIATTPPRYRLELAVGDDAVRTLSGDDCTRLADAAALILALDIDPEAHERAAVEPPPPPPPDEVLVTPPVITPPPRPIRPRPTRTEAFLGGRVQLDSGSLPRTTLGLGATLELARGPFALEILGMGYTSQFTVGGPRNGAGGAYVELATFGAHGCVHHLAWSLDYRGCVGGEVGREATRGVSIAQPATSAGTFGAISAMGRIRAFPTFAVTPTLGVEIGHPVTAPRVVIERFGTVFEPDPVFFRVFLGLEAQFL